MNATCIMGQAVCRRACTQHAGSMQQAVKNAACCIYAKCLVLARCIFHSMHSAFSQHAAHCVLSSRISHCSHPFAGPVRSSAPSHFAASSEKCSILHVASSKQQAAKSAAYREEFCSKQRKFCMQQAALYAASSMQQAAKSAACCICAKYLVLARCIFYIYACIDYSGRVLVSARS